MALAFVFLSQSIFFDIQFFLTINFFFETSLLNLLCLLSSNLENNKCNCDQKNWDDVDNGILTDTRTLPVQQLRFGDSEGPYRNEFENFNSYCISLILNSNIFEKLDRLRIKRF